MSTIPLLCSAYLSKPNNVIYVSKVYYYDKNLQLTQNMPGNLSFSIADFLSNSGLLTVYNNLINYINLINPDDIPTYSPLASLSYGDYFINPEANNFQPTQIIQDTTSSNLNNSKIINFVANVDSEDLNFGTTKPDYTNVLTSINNNLSALVSKNNQSEITQKLSDIFEFSVNNNLYSVFVSKNGVYNGSPDKQNFQALFSRFLLTLTTLNSYYALFEADSTDNNKLLSRIQKCIKFDVPLNSSNDINENLVYIKNYLNQINNKLSETVSNVDIPLLKEIALAIASLSSANDNQAIKALKDTISALELKVENNNVLLIDGQQDFCIKDYRELEPNSD